MKYQIAYYLVLILLVFNLDITAQQSNMQGNKITSRKIINTEQTNDKTLSPYFLIKSTDSTIEQLPLYSTSADVQISSAIADVTVKQVYQNTGKKPIEAIYVFPASSKCAVYAMKMTIGERVLNAEIQKREEARKNYEKAKSEGKTASLLEQERPNVFQMNVANIMPGDTIIVEMKYTELIIPDDAIYEFVFPTVVGPRYSNQSQKNANQNDRFVETPYQNEKEMALYKFDMKINILSGIPIDSVGSSSHNIIANFLSPNNLKISLPKTEEYSGNRDFILKYMLAGKQIQTGLLLSKQSDENYFLLMLQPPKRVVEEQIPAREYIFIIDVSGSMRGFPLDIAKKTAGLLFDKLNQNDKFNILLFSGSSDVFSENSVIANQENKTKALDFINKNAGGGVTELLPALKRVIKLPKPDGVSRSLIIFSDGYVNIETQAFDLISQNLNKANFFSFGVGSSVNRFLLDGVARAGRGEPFYITNPSESEAIVNKFVDYIKSPVMTDIKVDWGDFLHSEIEPPQIPDLLANRPILIYGKWTGSTDAKIKITGITADTKYSTIVDVKKFASFDNSNALKYLWARNKIARLGDYTAIDKDAKAIETVTELGLKHHLLTNYTSFVAVDYLTRREGDSVITVKQVLPLPEGVTNDAIGHQNQKMAPIIARRSSVEDAESSPLIPSKKENNTIRNLEEKVEKEIIYQSSQVDKQANYDDNELNINLVYPKEINKLRLEGKVLAKVLVDKNGIVADIKMEFSDWGILNKYVINAINKTKFTPAIKNNNPVSSWLSVPILFKLSKDSKINNQGNWVSMGNGFQYRDIEIGTGKEIKEKSTTTLNCVSYPILAPKSYFIDMNDKIVNYIFGKNAEAKEFEAAMIGMKVGGTRIVCIDKNKIQNYSKIFNNLDSVLYIKIELKGIK